MSKVYSSVTDNKNRLSADYSDCSDFLLRECEICGTPAIVCVLDGMINSLQLSQMIMRPILSFRGEYETGAQLFSLLQSSVLSSLELSVHQEFEQAHFYLSSGFAILFVDGVSRFLALGIQGFEKRGIDEPNNEANIKGAKECFTETLNDNKALLHRRIKSPKLKLKQLAVGSQAQTAVALAYIDGYADKTLVDAVERRIKSAPINVLQDYGELVPFLDTKIKSNFSATGNTERPDVLCSKLLEGRVGVLVDGSPFAIYVPCLFMDNFSTVDDYDNNVIFATLNRLLKYFSFVISAIFPGFYVATGTFHQELIPTSLMFSIASAEATTPFSLMQEAIMILILYEIMREAGLRLPKAIGHAVSIIGALVIGDAIVNAGLVGTPMLVVIAVTAIASYVIYPLYESVAVLRLAFVILGGTGGIYGIVLGLCLICINICAINPYGVPFSSPISPFDKKSFGDVFVRQSWKSILKRKIRIQNLRGAVTDEI